MKEEQFQELLLKYNKEFGKNFVFCFYNYEGYETQIAAFLSSLHDKSIKLKYFAEIL